MTRPKLFTPRFFILIAFPFSLFAVRSMVHTWGSVQEVARLSFWPCPLKFLTGWDCPTCGLTRSVLAAWNGEFQLSFQYHFGGPLLLALCWFLFFMALADRLARLNSTLSQIRRTSQFQWLSRISVVAYLIWGFILRTPHGG